VEAFAAVDQENMVAVDHTIWDIVDFVPKSGDHRWQSPTRAFDMMYTPQTSCDSLPLSKLNNMLLDERLLA
jgi:hypothetical protein